MHGAFDLGPVHLEVASTTLVMQPPKLVGGITADPIEVGPFAVGEIAATMSPRSAAARACPAAGRSSGCRRTDGASAARCELPLGPVQVSAAAVLAMIGGQTRRSWPSWARTFLPPIQLSFGFSLDRVGGIVGVNRRADTDALRAAVRTGTAGDVLFAVARRRRRWRWSPPPTVCSRPTAARTWSARR